MKTVKTVDMRVWQHLEGIHIAGRSVREVCCDNVDWEEVKMAVF
jgi:hypothetical protein